MLELTQSETGQPLAEPRSLDGGLRGEFALVARGSRGVVGCAIARL